jgi:hypothetical protein
MKSAPVLAEHLDDDPVKGRFVPGEDAEQDKAHVTDARIGDQALEIGLGKGEHGPIENADDGQRHDRIGQVGGGAGEKGNGKPQQSIPSGFQEKAGQDDAPSRGRLGVGVGKPGVERDGRELNQKGRQKAEQKQKRRRGCEGRSEQFEVIKGVCPRFPAVDEIETQDSRQHQKTAQLGEDEELYGRVDSPFMPP